MHFSEKDNKSWVSDDGIYYCFIKFLEHKKPKRVTKISILFQYPGILWLSPFVVVPETTFPFVSTATIPIVSWFK